MLSYLKKSIAPKKLLAILTTILFFSCQKDISVDDGGIIVTPPDLSTKISSSVSGFVTDENNAAVMGATVQFGSSSITTDKYGYFEAKNVQVVKEAAVVTVNKPGYFKGIKTYMAKEGKAAFFRIKLIPKTISGNVNAAAGGTVTLANGLSIKLPAGGIVNAATNTAYTGTVNVAAFWINPTATDLNKIMPGDLRGINTEGSIKLLQTFGMSAVELTGSSGELLQIVNGQKATITLPIPSSLTSAAPATIPLWYFDETKGLWKQEGRATKTGNSYVGDVVHFSFWNWDSMGNYVQLNCTLKDAALNPIPYTQVRITVAGSNYSATGYTDASGYVAGPIPENAQLILEVYSNYYCTSAVYTQNFATTNANVSLGNITINNTASVSGTTTDCNNSQVTNGYIVMLSNDQWVWYPLSNTGTFNFTTVLCSNTTPTPVTLVAEDLNGMQQSISYNTTLVTGSNTIANLQACSNSTAEFFTYTLNGTNYSFTAPADSIICFTDPSNSGNIYITANHIGTFNATYLNFVKAGMAVNSLQSLNSFYPSPIQMSTIPNPISVHITEYGAIGQFVSGNFTGTFIGSLPPNTVYNVVCSFRVRRTF